MNPTHSQEQVCFQLEHALALQQWAQIEGSLGVLTSVCVEPAAASNLFTAYYAIENFRSKLAFVNRLLHPKIDDNEELKTEWRSIKDHVASLSKKRNQLAHWRLIHYMEGEPGRRVLLQQPVFDPYSKEMKPKPGKPPTHAIGLMGIYNIRVDFFDASMSLMNFQAKLRGMPPLFRTDASPRSDIDKLVADYQEYVRKRSRSAIVSPPPAPKTSFCFKPFDQSPKAPTARGPSVNTTPQPFRF